jgi:murein DD-endopeptidase MepM/ murein hydrolase activator NlpD
MSFDLKPAADFVAQCLANKELTAEHIVLLTRAWQAAHGLADDGKPGKLTVAALEQELRKLRKQPIVKAYPLRELPDGRRPQITSGFYTNNPSRPTHKGVDLFYPYNPKTDPPVKVGDGGATRDAAGKPKWFIPDKECARAAADGVVTMAGRIATGFRVTIEHLDGNETIYCHLRDVRVAVGQSVALGTPLGEVGDNPIDVDAEHLHFEVSPAGVYQPFDPAIWLQGAAYFVG